MNGKTKIYDCGCKIVYNTAGDELLHAEPCYNHSNHPQINPFLQHLELAIEQVIESENHEDA